MKPILFSILLLFTGSAILSCIQVYGLTNDYNKLSDEQKSLISPLKSFGGLENGKIYTINTVQL
jgi:hypothetical protein